MTNTSAVIIVPQNADGTFTTNIEYVVKKWFEMDRVVTNETGKAAGVIEGVEGNTGRWKLQLNGIKLSDPESRKFEVTAFTRDTSKIANLKEKGIDKNDPYYPAVVDWLQRFDEGDIKLAEYWNSEKGPYIQDGEPRTLSLKEMYWLDIPPVSQNPSAFENSEWVVKGWMSGRVEIPVAQTNVFTGECMTNVRVSVTMMISNRLENVAHAPCTLQGVEPGSTSSNYTGSAWNSVAFSITGVLLNKAGGGQTTGIRRPLNWFTFGPNSFTNFTRQIEVVDPFSKNSVGYSYGWYLYPQATVGYAWSIGDATNRPPTTIYQLNDDTALIGE